MTAVGVVVIAAGAVAVIEDIARRRISNWISASALLAGLAIHAVHEGWHGAMTAVAGASVGFAIFAVFYFLHGLGGGDIKLMAGFGSLLGPWTILWAAWIAAVAGGLLAVVTAGLLRVRALSSGGRATRADAIPYAPAIVAGVWLAEMARG